MNAAERQEAWRSLQATEPPRPGEFRVFELSVRAPGGKVLFALDADGLRHLFVGVPAGEHVAADRRSRGVHLGLRSLEERDERHLFIDVACRRRELNTLFDQLVGDMLAAIEEGQASADRACREVLARWRSLLDRDPTAKLGLSELVGLFGELQCVRRLADTPRSLHAWAGPDGNRHDFVGPGMALEIKATLSSAGRVAEIHGVDQLDAPDGFQLFLGWFLVERDDFTGASLPQLVEELLTIGIDRMELLERLLRVGYDHRDADDYADLKFRIADERYYVVDARFPKIVRASFAAGDIPARTSRLAYIIDLGGDEPRPVDAAFEADLFVRLGAMP